MLRRRFGETGQELSAIGFGGILVSGESQADANNFVAEAIDRGIDYFDVAPSYGNAEERLGPALIGKRNKVFLACKTEKRTGKEAEQALYESLEKLKTDYFDLYQLHGVANMEEVQAILSPGGALEVFVKAKEKGLIGHIGFSVHSEEAAAALMDSFDFASVLFPVNWVNYFNSGFGKGIMEKAIAKGLNRFALKAMARTFWEEGAEHKYSKCWYEPVDDKALAQLALRFTLSQPVTAAVPPGDMRLFRWALEIGENFKPITAEEEAELQSRSKGIRPIFPQ